MCSLCSVCLFLYQSGGRIHFPSHSLVIVTSLASRRQLKWDWEFSNEAFRDPTVPYLMHSLEASWRQPRLSSPRMRGMWSRERFLERLPYQGSRPARPVSFPPPPLWSSHMNPMKPPDACSFMGLSTFTCQSASTQIGCISTNWKW